MLQHLRDIMEKEAEEKEFKYNDDKEETLQLLRDIVIKKLSDNVQKVVGW